uniref:probable G-protein coupled receptor 139 n=1 Tax=Myxine glutinosa TaxID=7769 RepID=UPI00358DE8BB
MEPSTSSPASPLSTAASAINGSLLVGQGGGPSTLTLVSLVYYSSLLFAGLPTNALTLVVLSRLARQRHKSSYNYLLGLTAADILILLIIVLPDFVLTPLFSITRTTLHLPRFTTSLHPPLAVAQFAANHASAWVAVPLTVDRYIAACHPFRYCTLSYPARARRIVAFVFGACVVSALPFGWWPGVGNGGQWAFTGSFDDGVGGGYNRTLPASLVWFHCTTAYVVPCLVFCVLNLGIVLHLRCANVGTLIPRAAATGRTTAILLAITSLFLVLWAPRVGLALYNVYHTRVPSPLPEIANMVALLSSTVNFFLYCFVSRRFRAGANEVLWSIASCRPVPGGFTQGTHSTLSTTSSLRIATSNVPGVKMLAYQQRDELRKL